ncbi:unnamed protein product [Paramecium octaurelia]|uniref:Uncharacterized protein n=1 Tax=Paramecium octaurelia TaxID=43137 RepID=A0A8S1UJN7_PAROT|nr:unnamed protein product [Paramecium octaurelia]
MISFHSSKIESDYVREVFNKSLMNLHQLKLNRFILNYGSPKFLKKRNIQSSNLNDVTNINIGSQTNILIRKQSHCSFYIGFLIKYVEFIVGYFIHKIWLLNLQNNVINIWNLA